MITTFRTNVHGRSIELPVNLTLPEGHLVEVTIKTCPEVESPQRPSAPIPPVETWCDRLVFDSSVHPVERIVKGTRLEAEALVAELAAGKSDEELLQAHPVLKQEDVQALRNYAKAPVGLRRSFGAWAEDAEELDKYLEWNRQQRKQDRREIDE